MLLTSTRTSESRWSCRATDSDRRRSLAPTPTPAHFCRLVGHGRADLCWAVRSSMPPQGRGCHARPPRCDGAGRVPRAGAPGPPVECGPYRPRCISAGVETQARAARRSPVDRVERLSPDLANERAYPRLWSSNTDASSPFRARRARRYGAGGPGPHVPHLRFHAPTRSDAHCQRPRAAARLGRRRLPGDSAILDVPKQQALTNHEKPDSGPGARP